VSKCLLGRPQAWSFVVEETTESRLCGFAVPGRR
jgi:hypothetical protein